MATMILRLWGLPTYDWGDGAKFPKLSLLNQRVRSRGDSPAVFEKRLKFRRCSGLVTVHAGGEPKENMGQALSKFTCPIPLI